MAQIVSDSKKTSIVSSSLSDTVAQGALPERRNRRETLWGGMLRVVTQGDTTFNQRKIDTLNRGLQRAWNSGDPFRWILARVRCEILKCTPREYDHLINSGRKGLWRLELPVLTTTERPVATHYSKLFRAWDRIAKESSGSAISEALREAKEIALRTLSSRHKRAIYGLLYAWRCEAGPGAFEQKTGFKYATVWTRAKCNYLYTFKELTGAAKALGWIDDKLSGAALWNHPRTVDIRTAILKDSAARMRPAPVVELHMLLEAAGYTISSTCLKETPEFAASARTSTLINQFRLVPLREVKGVFDHLQVLGLLDAEGRERLETAWSIELKNTPKTFEAKIRRHAQKQGLNTSEIAFRLGLNPEETYRGRTAAPIRAALKNGEYRLGVTPAAIAYAVGASSRDISALLACKRRDLVTDLLRCGHGGSLNVIAERTLWGVQISDIYIDAHQLERIEQNRKSEITPADAIEAIRAAGLRQVQAVIERRLEADRPSTVTALYAMISRRFGVAPASDALNTSSRVLNAYRHGSVIPTLTALRRACSYADIPFSEEIVVDWFDKVATYEVRSGSSDLKRVLAAIMYESTDSQNEYFRGRDVSRTAHEKSFQYLDHSGTWEKGTLQSVLGMMGISDKSPEYTFVTEVWQKGSIAAALTALAADPQTWGPIKRALSFVADAPETSSAHNITQPTSKLTSEPQGEAAVYARSIFPGVSSGELKQVADAAASRLDTWMAETLERLNSKGITVPALVFALDPIIARDKRSPALVRLALENTIWSPLTAPGILAVLSAESEEERREHLADARRICQQSLGAVLRAPTELDVEMRVWGIRLEELVRGRQVQGETLRSDEKVRELTQQATRLGDERAQQASLRLAYFRSKCAPQDMAYIADRITPGRSSKINAELSLKLGTVSRIAEGALCPFLHVSQGIQQVADLPFSESHLIQWYLAYAEYTEKLNLSPFARCIATHTAAIPGKGFVQSVERHVRDTLVLHGFSPHQIRDILGLVQKSSPPQYPVPFKKLAVLSGETDLDLRISFMREAQTTDTIVDAVIAWSRKHEKDPVTGALGEVDRFLESANGSDMQSIRPWETPVMEAPSPEFVRLVKILGGATLKDLQKAHGVLKQSITRVLTAPKARIQSAPDARQLLSASGSVSDRLSRLSDLLSRETVPTTTNLELYLPELQNTIKALRMALNDEVIWFVGCTGLYDHPIEAIQVLHDTVASGWYAAKDGKGIFNDHVNRALERHRAGLTPMTPKGFRMYFREPVKLR